MIPVLFYLPGTCAFGSIVALEWLGHPFQLCRLDEVSLKSDDYKKINPLQLVPTFKTTEGILTESAAILQHIGFLDLTKKMSFKQGTQDFDRLNEMISFLTTSLHGSIGPIVHPDRTADDEKSQQAVVHRAKTVTVPSRFEHLEQILKKQNWLVGDRPSVADAYFYGVGRTAMKFIDFDKNFPQVADFFKRFKLDPGVEFAQAIEDQKTPKSQGGFKGEVTLNQIL